MNPRHPQIALRAGHRCEYCHAPEAVFNSPFEVEHIVPVSREGTDTENNLALSCRSCNARKSAFMEGFDPESEVLARLFHPRDNDWGQHFGILLETAQIEGLTPIGRATVLRLEMNSPAQCAARRQWMRLGLFP